MQKNSPRRRISKGKPTISTPKAHQQLLKNPLSVTTRHSTRVRKPTQSLSIRKKLNIPTVTEHKRLFSAGRNRAKGLPLITNESAPNSSRNSSLLKLNTSRTIGVSDQKPEEQETIKLKASYKKTPPDPLSLFDTLTVPISPATALKLFMKTLTNYEHGEILEFPQIYFLGLKAEKTKTNLSAVNNGYDDERGDYNLVIGDHIGYRYETMEILGKGSFGQVCKCFDHKRKEFQALKIIRNKKRFHQQGAVEVKVLDLMKHHDSKDVANVIHMKNYFVFRRHLCITFELLSINLYELMKSNSFQGFSLGLIRRFAIELLCSLSFTRSLKIIHCDLKPENILLKQPNKSGIKVIDYGSSCMLEERIYTYIQSRFYRAPEIILGIPYTSSIDMWSFGCILAELFMGYPLFPGESETEELLCMMEVLGLPPENVMELSERKKNFFDNDFKPRVVPNSRGRLRYPATRTLEDKVKCSDDMFLDLIERCLHWDPELRLLPEEGLEHPWIEEELKSRTNQTVK